MVKQQSYDGIESDDLSLYHSDKRQKYEGNVFTFNQIGKVIQLLLNQFYPHRFCNELKYTSLTKKQTKDIMFATDQFGKVILNYCGSHVLVTFC